MPGACAPGFLEIIRKFFLNRTVVQNGIFALLLDTFGDPLQRQTFHTDEQKLHGLHTALHKLHTIRSFLNVLQYLTPYNSYL